MSSQFSYVEVQLFNIFQGFCCKNGFFLELFPHHSNILKQIYTYFDYASSLNTPHVHCNVANVQKYCIYQGIFEYLFEMTTS
jgi:hypothetical protein